MEADVRAGSPAGAREGEGSAHLRDVDDPNHVFIFLEFESTEDAREAQSRLIESGVLDRFEDRHGPNVLQEA